MLHCTMAAAANTAGLAAIGEAATASTGETAPNGRRQCNTAVSAREAGGHWQRALQLH